MSSHTFSAADLDEAQRLLTYVVEAFTDEEESEPTLGELLEILGSSLPTNSPHMGASPFPLVFTAKLAGNRRYKPDASERVAGLNDNTFTEAAELLAFLVERAAAVTGQESSPTDLANYVLQVLHAANHRFADLTSDTVTDLTVKVPKRVPKPTVGDVVAIPAEEPAGTGYHLAIVLADDRVGLALGLLHGIAPSPQLGATNQYRAQHIPVYVGKHSIVDGTWKTVGHREELLELFPDPPEVYYEARTVFGETYGEHGGAGTVDGDIRLIGKDEAEAVGLLDGTYRQSYVSDYFQTLLNEGRFDNGPLPGTWR